ncbi:MAG: DUF3078 domain-containing protein, partial [Alistipes sp.]|nr:DUF3078 domain-containing protein [Alistipes sp.]
MDDGTKIESFGNFDSEFVEFITFVLTAMASNRAQQGLPSASTMDLQKSMMWGLIGRILHLVATLMKKSSIRWIGWILFFLVCYTPGKAQFSISKVTPREAEVQIKPGTIKPLGAFNNPFASEARMRAERRRIRKERNTFTMVFGLNLSQTKFENWAAGGANSFAGWASVQMTHIYVKDKIRLTTQFESKYGLNINSGKSFKNLDYFNLNFNAARSISKNWSYSASTNLRSQWSKGFRSATDKTMVSNILSPGYWTVGGG